MQELGVHALNLVKPHTLLNGQIPHRNKPSLRLKLFNRFTFKFFYFRFKQQKFLFYFQQNEQIGLSLTLKKQFKVLQIITFLNILQNLLSKEGVRFLKHICSKTSNVFIWCQKHEVQPALTYWSVWLRHQIVY